MMMTTASSRSNVGGDMNAVSKLHEAFQILDRDSDGVVGRDDVADMLTQLGKPPFNSTSSKSNVLTTSF
jgi:Ca2+-binding EF-hand superfamily protein